MISSNIVSKPLSVSIVAGPSAQILVREMAALIPKSRFAFLTCSDVDECVTGDKLMMEQLVTTKSGGYNLEQIRAQITATAAKGSVDHLVIECDSKTHPIAFASLFLPNSSDSQRFLEIARLSSILLAVEAKTLLRSIVHGDRSPGVTSSCILADQIECADVIVLNSQPIDDDFILAQAVASALNPRARILQRSGTTIPASLPDAETSFDFEAALAGAGWRKLMDGESGVRHDDRGVTTFVYRARRPLHPEKFWNLIQNPFPGVFRAKGFFWLATRMDMVGGLNIAGWECHHSPAGQWWAAQSRGHNDDAPIPDRIRKEWSEPFGDRRQAIAFMGIDLDPAKLTAQLDLCLLNESEMTSGASSWATLPDPFPAWAAKGHDHECEDHDCCHH